VAEDLKVLNLAWDCGTEKLLEEATRKYVVRPAGNATTEMMATLLYLLKTKPDFKTVAIVNQDYSWGRDSRDILVDALKVLKPEAKIVAEMFPKFGASDFSTEISRLQALRPDVIISTSWGGDLDTLVVCLGGGGLLAGSALAAHAMSPGCAVVGVEPEAGNDGQQSLARGEIVTIAPPQSIADGAVTPFVGRLPFAIMQRDVTRIVTVTDAQLVETMRFFATRMKLVVEPTGCLAAAAVLHGVLPVAGQRVGVVLSGGNVDAAAYGRLLASGLA